MPLVAPYRPEGFSLVEVVIATGIVSVVIITIIGLLTVGLRNSRESAEDTNLALMTQTISSLVRTRSFSNVYSSTDFSESNTDADYFFDANGTLVRDATGAPASNASADSHFACTITRRTPSLAPVSSSNCIYLQYRFTWPLSAQATNRRDKVGFTSLANYE